MEISKKGIEKFKKIYKQEFGVSLSDNDTLEKGQRVLRLFKIIYRPLPKTPEND